ncbi:hydrogen peroxide-inducible genes activator [Undibacter mobilis]|uniref:Hydrogen peroxide-inducible genes activator n=1 Tax=Undibacter mobilis TaxID=2292256 RepID=A0A371B8N2_9BRAD|nr:hydrogen peroxide-inducible genes activator [Undibacter mobilis]RDV03959.1 hydrogen peroxide-inducible genes activator [Undibacter mobilis]
MITLRQLRYLSSLARHRHFGRAADDCAVTQPALSMQVRELEREIGAELVERRPGDIVLTEIGAEVARRAEHILASTRDLVDFARHREVLAGPLKLGIIPTLAPYILPRVLPHLQRQYRQLRLEVRETQTTVLLDELANGSLDVVMLALPAEGADVETLPLFDDAFLLAVPADDPLPPRARIGVGDVDQRRLILLEEGHCLRDQALAFCATRRGDQPAGLGATSLSTVMQMVANGYGVTLVPEVAIDAKMQDPRVKLLRFRDPEPGRSVGLAWRKTSPRARDFEALGEVMIAAHARDQAADVKARSRA